MNDKKKILVIDDEHAIRRFLRASLESAEYQVFEASSAGSGINQVASVNPDVILLDLGLPDLDGLKVIEEIRIWTKIPIIVLSARGKEQDKVLALDSGANDYLTKPFSVQELQARIRVFLRTFSEAKEQPEFEYENLKVDFGKRQVWLNSQEVHLTPIEYKILVYMINNAGKVITHKQLLKEIWGNSYIGQNQYVRVYMAQLRQKIEINPGRPKILITEVGIGYRLKV